MKRHPEGTRRRRKGELINMAQYDPLRDYLSEYKGNELTRTFKEIDNIIAPKALPPSAYNLRQVWQNSYSHRRRHVQAAAWQNAGWKVSKVDLQRQIVTFCRMSAKNQ